MSAITSQIQHKKPDNHSDSFKSNLFVRASYIHLKP